MSEKISPREGTTALPCESNPDLWFQELSSHKRAAKRGCEACPLQVACREEALARHMAGQVNDGIWGGMDLEGREAEAARRQDAQEVVAA